MYAYNAASASVLQYSHKSYILLKSEKYTTWKLLKIAKVEFFIH